VNEDPLFPLARDLGEWTYIGHSREMIETRLHELATTIRADVAQMRAQGDSELVARVDDLLRAYDWQDTAPTTEERLRVLEEHVQHLMYLNEGVEVIEDDL